MQEILIFTDGASRGNPGKGGWGAIVLNDNDVKEYGGREDNTTNNRMEMSAVLGALTNINSNKKIILYTDSSYVAKGITAWVKNWKASGWKTKDKKDVLNKDLWEKIDSLLTGKDIEVKILEGHVGVPGNERCDQIATAYADKDGIELYSGLFEDYKIDLLNFNKNSVSKTHKDRSKIKAYSYLSLVDGEFRKHDTWVECEARVKGKKGVLYRKSISRDDEEEIKKEWGVK